MTIFKPRLSFQLFTTTNLILIPIFFVILFIERKPLNALLPVICIFAILNAFLLIIVFTTRYKIDNNYFYYRSFFLFGKIDIQAIHKLEVGTTMYAGIKPATASKGIIIRYNKYDDIYISPINNEDFVKEILKINPKIEVVYPKKHHS